MDVKIYYGKRMVGKTTMAIEEFLKDYEKTLFVSPISSDRNFILRYINEGLCREIILHNNEKLLGLDFNRIFRENITNNREIGRLGGHSFDKFRGRIFDRVILDEYFHYSMDIQCEIYKRICYHILPKEVLIFSSPRQTHSVGLIKFVKDMKNMTSPFDDVASRMILKGVYYDQRTVNDLYYNFLTDNNARFFKIPSKEKLFKKKVKHPFDFLMRDNDEFINMRNKSLITEKYTTNGKYI